MPVLPIVTHPAPVLRRKARKVTDFGPELQKLVDNMIETMRDAPGVGLAAPQVDVPLRLIVVEYAEEAEDEEGNPKETLPKLYVLANPEIMRLSDESEVGTEGCLSIPGFVGDVERPLGAVIKGLNRHGKPVRVKADGWLARIFQHEIDHLEGILYIDRAEKVWRLEEGESSPVPAD